MKLVPARNTRDRYHRLLAYLVMEETGRMLNEALVASGHAYADPRFDHPLRERFRELEAGARQSGLGLWKHVKPAHYPYWKQKRRR